MRRRKVEKLARKNNVAIHMRYLELQEEFPDLYPRQDAGKLLIGYYDVPECRGSYTWNGKHSDENMVNCACPGDWSAWGRRVD